MISARPLGTEVQALSQPLKARKGPRLLTDDTVLDFADVLSITLRGDDVQEFYTRWDEIRSSMSKNPPENVQESLYKLRIGESDQLNRFGIVRHGNSSEDIKA